MLPVWTSVKVINKDHARFSSAGVVHATNPDKPDQVVVKFDTDGTLESVSNADLQAL